MASEQNLDVSIQKQIKFYFSDANLLRDRFLKAKLTEDQGWTTIDCLLTFKRLAQLTTDPKQVLSALKADSSNFFEIEEESMKIRRSSEFPLPALSFKQFLDNNKEHVFCIEGFSPSETLATIERFLESESIETQFIQMKFEKGKKFSGKILAIVEDQDSIKKLTDSSIKLTHNETVLKITQHEVDTSKNSHTEKSAKKGDKNTRESTSNSSFPSNSILKISSVPAEITFKQVKDSLNVFKPVKWVERNTTGDLIAFFVEEGAAPFVFEQLKSSEGKLNIGNTTMGVSLLTEDEQAASWGLFTSKKRKSRNFSGGKRRRN